MIGGGIDFNNGGGAKANIRVAKGGDLQVIHLSGPFGRSKDLSSHAYLKVRIMSIVLNISSRRGGEGLLVV